MSVISKTTTALFLMAFASLESAAGAQVLLNPSDLIKSSDYPEGPLRRYESGITTYEVVVSGVTGRVLSCEILRSSGSPELDAATCRLISERAIYDVKNSPKNKILRSRSSVRWTLPKIENNIFQLTCIGGGVTSEQEGSYGTYFAPNGQMHSGVIYTPSQKNYEENVLIEIFGNSSGRVRLPRSILPSIRGGNDGWFDLRNIVISQNEISAEAKVNFVNHPKIIIDRVRGTIFIDARRGAYNGRCQRQSEQTTRQF